MSLSRVRREAMPFGVAMSRLALELQFGKTSDLDRSLEAVTTEHFDFAETVVKEGTNWRKADATKRATYLGWLSIFNESLARSQASRLLGGGEGYAVQELANATAGRVAKLIACGLCGEAGCGSFEEFRSLVERTAIGVLQS